MGFPPRVEIKIFPIVGGMCLREFKIRVSFIVKLMSFVIINRGPPRVS